MTDRGPDANPPYRGRFAPSPTGPLHFGSLVAALASCLDARAAGGEWLVRMEDVDRSREVPGAADQILRALEAFGFEWDGPVMYQQHRDEAYGAALERLLAAGHAFPCACTRRELETGAPPGPQGRIYPGTCREGLPPGREARAVRVRVDGAAVRFEDRLLGPQGQDLAAEVGDFVVRRGDGLFAYQLAVVVDDAAQGITDVVRGSDLLGSTPRQIHLQRLLGLPTPRYLHLPVAVDARGVKLSKQTGAPPVDARQPLPALCAALRFLGHAPPREACTGSLNDFWRWAIGHWSVERLPRRSAIEVSESPPPR